MSFGLSNWTNKAKCVKKTQIFSSLTEKVLNPILAGSVEFECSPHACGVFGSSYSPKHAFLVNWRLLSLGVKMSV